MIEKRDFGKTSEYGEPVQVYTITAGEYRMSVSTLGGTILSLFTPDAQGRIGNIALGLATVQDYEKSTTYMGALIGRFANRIKAGKFSIDEIDTCGIVPDASMSSIAVLPQFLQMHT